MSGDKLALSGLGLCDVQTSGLEGTTWDLVGLGVTASVADVSKELLCCGEHSKGRRSMGMCEVQERESAGAWS